MATIRKRGSKWQVQVRRKGSPPVSRSFLSRKDAAEWGRQAEALVDRRGLSADPRILDDLTLGQLLFRYRDNVVVAKRSAPVETTILNAFLRHRLASMPIGRISSAHFSAYRDERLAEVGSATVIRELGILQHAFETARRDWAIPLSTNPLKLIAKPKAPKPRGRRLESGELERLLSELGNCRNMLVRPLVILAIATGMRLGELLRIEPQHVRFDMRTLLVPITKNGHPRTIPLSSEAIKQLQGLASGSYAIMQLITVEHCCLNALKYKEKVWILASGGFFWTRF
jgi:integrase